MYEWQITRIRSTPAALIGHVELCAKFAHRGNALVLKHWPDEVWTTGGAFAAVVIESWRVSRICW
jgi:hypothetical protein